jgi:DNA mismatch repair ATPase MutL
VQEWDQNYGNGVWTPSANQQQQPLMSQQYPQQPPPSRVQRSNNQQQARRQPNPRQQASNSSGGGQRQPRGAPAGQQQQWQPRQQQNEPRRQQQDRRQYQQQQQPEYQQQQQRTEERSERRPLNDIVNERNENFAVEAEHANSPEPSLARFVAAFLFYLVMSGAPNKCYWELKCFQIIPLAISCFKKYITIEQETKMVLSKLKGSVF